jgi:hypothetical protein
MMQESKNDILKERKKKAKNRKMILIAGSAYKTS